MADTELNNLINEIQRTKINIKRAKTQRLQLTQRDIFRPRVRLTEKDIFTPRARLTERDILINERTFPDLEESRFRIEGRERISDEKKLEMLIRNRRKRAKKDLENRFEQKETLVNGVLLNDAELKIFDELSGRSEISLQKLLVGRGDIRDKRIKPNSSLQKALNVELKDLRRQRLKSMDEMRDERFNFNVKNISLKTLSKTLF